MKQTLYIKNMVCDRCIKVLKNEIEAQGIALEEIELGYIKLDIQDKTEINKLKAILESNGFELIDSVEDRLTEQVKIQLIKKLGTLPLDLKERLSTYLAEKMNQNYSKVSKVFSYTEGMTIEKYFIKLKIEKVKELIEAQERNFTEISELLDYSHINHLSRQFKTETGLSLSQYKAQQKKFRNPLDQIV